MTRDLVVLVAISPFICTEDVQSRRRRACKRNRVLTARVLERSSVRLPSNASFQGLPPSRMAEGKYNVEPEEKSMLDRALALAAPWLGAAAARRAASARGGGAQEVRDQGHRREDGLPERAPARLVRAGLCPAPASSSGVRARTAGNGVESLEGHLWSSNLSEGLGPRARQGTPADVRPHPRQHLHLRSEPH